MVVLLTTDLLLASRIQGAASGAGIALQTVLSVDQCATTCGTEQVTGLLLDLEHPGLNLSELWQRIPRREQCWVVATGPHVQTERLAAARTAGCDEVLSRGRLDRDLSDVLFRLSRGRTPGEGGTEATSVGAGQSSSSPG